MIMIYIMRNLIDAIKNHALSSKNEIYGWLIGYKSKNDINVIAFFECLQYEQQTMAIAIPNAKEFQEISSILPQGIGPVGIYHSHPFSDVVAHSNLDNHTLLSLANQFPNCISIVTNGHDIKFYQIDKKNRINEINVKIEDLKVPDFLVFSLKVQVLLKLELEYEMEKHDHLNLKIKILNLIKEYFEDVWDNLIFLVDGSIISDDTKIRKFLTDNLESNIIHLNFSNKINQNNNEEVILLAKSAKKGKNVETPKVNELFDLSINLKSPFYVFDMNLKLKDLKDVLKVELINNNLLKKILLAKIDSTRKKIITPNDFYLKFLGFYLRLPIFNDPTLNRSDIAREAQKIARRIISTYKYFPFNQSDNNFKKLIFKSLKNVEHYSSLFHFSNEINELIKDVKSMMN